MSVPRYLVDSNVLLRFLTGEPAKQAGEAKELFTRASAGELLLDVSPLIVAEAYYTLNSFYRVERPEAAAKLLLLIGQRGVKLRDASQVTAALERLRAVNIGFADAFLAAGAVEENVPVVSFDRDFDKLKEIRRIDPAGLRPTTG